MKKLIHILIFLLPAVLIYSCVDEYYESNPPRLKDAPALYSVSAENELVRDGSSTKIFANVVDAPAGVDSVGLEALNEEGDPVGTFTVITPITGQTKVELEISYTAPSQTAGDVTITVQVFDKQFDEKGEMIRKSSEVKSITITIYCEPELVGTYSVLGEFLRDDFNSPDVEEEQDVISVDCAYAYEIEDISGGLYTTTYGDNYGTSARRAVIHLDPGTNLITWDRVSDQFGGEFVQDPDQPDSNYDPATETITIYWTATAYGERGITTMTKN